MGTVLSSASKTSARPGLAEDKLKLTKEERSIAEYGEQRKGSSRPESSVQVMWDVRTLPKYQLWRRTCVKHWTDALLKSLSDHIHTATTHAFLWFIIDVVVLI